MLLATVSTTSVSKKDVGQKDLWSLLISQDKVRILYVRLNIEVKRNGSSVWLC